MNLIAPPAFTDHPDHLGRSAGVVDSAALDAQQRVLAAILVTPTRAAPHLAGRAEAAARLAVTPPPLNNALR